MPTPTTAEQNEKEKVLLAFALHKLFVNRPDSYIRQKKDGTYEKEKKSLTPAILLAHQKGQITVATYQLNLENQVKWLCFDIDPQHNPEPLKTAIKLIRTCLDQKLFNKSSIILEASRYPDPSYHVWVFFNPSIPAKAAQWLGESVILKGQIKTQVELFPKQTEISQDGYGNAVKVPLGFHREEKKWSQFLDFETLQPLPNGILFDVEEATLSETDIEKVLFYADLPKFVRPKQNATFYRNSKKIRPCITEAIKNDLTGSPENHKMRVAVVAEYHAANYSKDDIIDLFKNQKDFNIKITTKQVEHSIRKPYPPFKCATIKRFNHCIGENCPLFRRSKRLFEKQVESLQ